MIIHTFQPLWRPIVHYSKPSQRNASSEETYKTQHHAVFKNRHNSKGHTSMINGGPATLYKLINWPVLLSSPFVVSLALRGRRARTVDPSACQSRYLAVDRHLSGQRLTTWSDQSGLLLLAGCVYNDRPWLRLRLLFRASLPRLSSPGKVKLLCMSRWGVDVKLGKRKSFISWSCSCAISGISWLLKL